MPALPCSNIAWLIEHGYQYLVVSREGHAKDPRDQEVRWWFEKLNTTASPFTANRCRNRRNPALLPLELKAKKTGHPQPLPHSFGRGARPAQCGLDKKVPQKLREILERIGRLREKTAASRRLQYWSHCRCRQNNAIRIEWKREFQSDQKDQHCGVYCLRTNIPDCQKSNCGQPIQCWRDRSHF